jgi:hypothetical protein
MVTIFAKFADARLPESVPTVILILMSFGISYETGEPTGKEVYSRLTNSEVLTTIRAVINMKIDVLMISAVGAPQRLAS